LTDPLKAKHLQRALESLAEEGVTQVFKPKIGSQWFVGVVGQLQLEVLQQLHVPRQALGIRAVQPLLQPAVQRGADGIVTPAGVADAQDEQ
ncbi:MAG: hypothetical protein ACOVOG_03565, partial [Rubrivivax sp.]